MKDVSSLDPIIVLADILQQSKFNFLDVFYYGNLRYIDKKGEWKKENFSLLTDFQLETRSNFPSDKVSLSIEELTDSNTILWFNVFLKLNGKHAVDLILEDSARNVIISDLWSNIILHNMF